MNIPKAIEDSNEAVIFLANRSQPRLANAVKLGLKALERWEAHRSECPMCFMELLPGETKD